MSEFVIPCPPQSALPVADSDKKFPVRRIWCVGRNYADHAREMGHDPDREPPFFFSKPTDAIVSSDSVLVFPSMTSNLHHEVELVVAIGVGGKEIDSESALEHVWGYGVGIDMTRRDLQAQAKKLQRPWAMGKGFDQSAPVSALRSVSEIGHPSEGRIWLKVNDAIRQDGNLNMQIWNVGETISHLSAFVELGAGDLLMTGTPAGVGPCSAGDALEGVIEGIGRVTVSYIDELS